MRVNRTLLLLVCVLGGLMIIGCGGKKEPVIKIETPKQIEYPEVLYIGDKDRADVIDLTSKNIIDDFGEKYVELIPKYVKVAGKAEYYTVDGYSLEKPMLTEIYKDSIPATPNKYVVFTLFTEKKETITILAESSKWGETIKKMPFNQQVVVVGKLSETVAKNTFSVVVDE
jgi:hypothetical protein